MEKEDQLAITFKLMDTDHDGRIGIIILNKK